MKIVERFLQQAALTDDAWMHIIHLDGSIPEPILPRASYQMDKRERRYTIAAHWAYMLSQMEQAIDGFEKMSADKRDAMRGILQRYVEGGMALDEAYYELLDAGLIPMPSRCAMKPKIASESDEARLKDIIKARILE